MPELLIEIPETATVGSLKVRKKRHFAPVFSLIDQHKEMLQEFHLLSMMFPCFNMYL